MDIWSFCREVGLGYVGWREDVSHHNNNHRHHHHFPNSRDLHAEFESWKDCSSKEDLAKAQSGRISRWRQSVKRQQSWDLALDGIYEMAWHVFVCLVLFPIIMMERGDPCICWEEYYVTYYLSSKILGKVEQCQTPNFSYGSEQNLTSLIAICW